MLNPNSNFVFFFFFFVVAHRQDQDQGHMSSFILKHKPMFTVFPDLSESIYLYAPLKTKYLYFRSLQDYALRDNTAETLWTKITY